MLPIRPWLVGKHNHNHLSFSQNLPPTPQKEPEKEGEDAELKKQEMLVQYLRDTETFALQVERAISVINTMLYWKTTSGRRQYSPECKPCSNLYILVKYMHSPSKETFSHLTNVWF